MSRVSFPKDFVFGFSESGFQFEMGLPGSEDPNSDWWAWVHDTDNIRAGLVSGDFPEDGPGYWHLYRMDHDIAERLGMDAARLGMEWSRIFPKPTFDVKVDYSLEKRYITHIDIKEEHLKKLDEIANKEAVEHYREIFQDWKARGKKLIVCLYHWPLPLWMHDPIKARRSALREGPLGWLDKRCVIEFAKYVAYVAWKYNDLVDAWATMNEPNVVYSQGYINVKSGFPPGFLDLGAAMKAMMNMIEAHARAYDAIKIFSKKPVGIIYAVSCIEPLKSEDEDVARRARRESTYAFLDAITRGVIEQGNIIRDDLRGRLDWLGVNYYTRLVVTSDARLGWRAVPGYGFLCQPDSLSLTGRPTSDFGWEVYPEGLHKVLSDLYARYKLPLMVTENGIADKSDRLRPRFIVSHIHQTFLALKEGVDVRGYLHWALVDNYEWASGFNMKFGLCQVDLKTKKRYLRPSALIFREIATRKSIPEELQYLTEPPC